MIHGLSNVAMRKCHTPTYQELPLTTENRSYSRWTDDCDTTRKDVQISTNWPTREHAELKKRENTELNTISNVGVTTATVVKTAVTRGAVTASAAASPSSINCAHEPTDPSEATAYGAACGHALSDIVPATDPGSAQSTTTTSGSNAVSSNLVTSTSSPATASETSSHHTSSATYSTLPASSPTSSTSEASNATAAAPSAASTDNQPPPKKTPTAAIAAGVSFGALALIAAIAGVLWRKRHRSNTLKYANEKEEDFSPSRYNYGGSAFYQPERFPNLGEIDGEPGSAALSSQTGPRDVDDIEGDGLTNHGSKSRRRYTLMNPDPPSSADTPGGRASLPFSEEGRDDDLTPRPSPGAHSMGSPVPSDDGGSAGQLSPGAFQAYRPESVAPSMYSGA